MRTIFPFIVLIILLITSCKEDEPTAPPEVTPPLIEVTIGNDGGALETEDFKLTVPPNSFNSGTTLTLNVEPDENPFGENSVSKLFRIDGIPDDFVLPLEVSIKYDGTLSGLNFIAIGREDTVEFLDSIMVDILYSLKDATESGGFLICQIPTNQYGTQQIYKSNIGGSLELFVGAVTGGNRFLYADHFKVMESLPENKQALVDELLLNLENSYQIFKSLNFSLSTRSWPLDVHITMSSSKDLFWIDYDSSFDEIECNFNPNFTQFNGRDRSFINFILFETIFYSYDFPYGKDWILWAICSWTTLVSIQSHSAFLNDWTNGFPKSEHCGILLEYLVERYGEDKLSAIVTEVGAISDPITAIINHTAALDEWLTDFYKYLIIDERFNFAKADFWVNSHSAVFTVNENTNQIDWTDIYTELSARWYNFILSPNLDPNTALTFSVQGGDPEFVLFKYKDDQITYMNTSVNPLTVSNVKSLADDGYNLLVVVTNRTNSRDNITIKVKKQNEYEYNICHFWLEIGAKIKNMNSTYNEMQLFERRTIQGEMNGNSFEADWDSTNYAGTHFTGSVNVTFSNDFQSITLVEYSDNWMSQNGTSSDSLYVVGTEIPYEVDLNRYRVDGVETCDHIPQMSLVMHSYGYTRFMVEKICVGFTSYINIGFE